MVIGSDSMPLAERLAIATGPLYPLTNTNNKWGWFHMVLAHYMRFCGAKDVDTAFETLKRESQLALRHWRWSHHQGPYVSEYLSDMGCIMVCNGWFFGGKDKELVNPKALEYWLKYI